MGRSDRERPSAGQNTIGKGDVSLKNETSISALKAYFDQNEPPSGWRTKVGPLVRGLLLIAPLLLLAVLAWFAYEQKNELRSLGEKNSRINLLLQNLPSLESISKSNEEAVESIKTEVLGRIDGAKPDLEPIKEDLIKLSGEVQELINRLPQQIVEPQPGPASKDETKPQLSDEELQRLADELHKRIVAKSVSPDLASRHKLNLFWFPSNNIAVYQNQIRLLHQFNRDATTCDVELIVHRAQPKGFSPIVEMAKLTEVFERSTITGNLRNYFSDIAAECGKSPGQSFTILASSEFQPDTKFIFSCNITCLLVDPTSFGNAGQENDLSGHRYFKEWARLKNSNLGMLDLVAFGIDGSTPYVKGLQFWVPTINMLTNQKDLAVNTK